MERCIYHWHGKDGCGGRMVHWARLGYVGGGHFMQDCWMTNGVLALFVDPGIEAGIIILPNLFPSILISSMILLDIIGWTLKESISWYHGLLNIQRLYELGNVRVMCFQGSPLILQDIHDGVALEKDGL